MALEPLMTWQEVADVLRTGRWRIDVLRKEGNLPAVKVGRTFRYRPDDVRAFIEASSKGAAPAGGQQ